MPAKRKKAKAEKKAAEKPAERPAQSTQAPILLISGFLV
jgi:hypothetical protein